MSNHTVMTDVIHDTNSLVNVKQNAILLYTDVLMYSMVLTNNQQTTQITTKSH